MTVALGLAAALLWATDNLISVRISRAIRPLPALFWSLGAGLVFAIVLSPVVDGPPGRPASLFALTLAVASAPLYLAGNAFFLLALKRGSLSIVAPLVGLEGGMAALISIVVLGQGIALITAAGLALAVVGATLAATGPCKRAATGAGWALASAASFAVTFVCYGEAGGMSPLGVVIANRAVAVALLAVWLIVKREPLRVPVSALRHTVALGGIDVVALALFAAAVAIGPIAVASVCASQFATLAAVLGVVVLAERLRLMQYVGVAITLVAVVVLSTTG